MNSYFVILRYEIFLLFISPATYVSSFYFLSLIGVGFRYFIESFIHTDWILAPLSSITLGLFFGSPALVPFLTMRSLAEEKKLGTLETLNTAPINFISLVIGKWTACFLFLLQLLCFVFHILCCLHYSFQHKLKISVSIKLNLGQGIYFLFCLMVQHSQPSESFRVL